MSKFYYYDMLLIIHSTEPHNPLPLLSIVIPRLPPDALLVTVVVKSTFP